LPRSKRPQNGKVKKIIMSLGQAHRKALWNDMAFDAPLSHFCRDNRHIVSFLWLLDGLMPCAFMAQVACGAAGSSRACCVQKKGQRQITYMKQIGLRSEYKGTLDEPMSRNFSSIGKRQ
jgi:hypothetical protein